MEVPESIAQLQTYDLDHLGIVAGIIDEIGLVETIDEVLGTHEQEVLSPGVVVKAMILNGLAFLSAPLYLFGEFFRGKATQHLLGQGILPEHLNDDKLGRVLDKLFEAGLTPLFVRLALGAAEVYQVVRKSLHLDSTSMHVHGEYEGARGKQPQDEETSEGDGLEVIRLTHGYSREGRPDLKQFMFDLMSSSDGDVPFFFRTGDGNENDKAVFGSLIAQYQEQLDLDTLFVADSALYSAENLEKLRGLSWLTRVPETIKETKELLDSTPEEAFEPSRQPGYRIASCTSRYADIPQRWLIIASSEGRKRELKSFEKRLTKLELILTKKLKELSKKVFQCEADARGAAEEFAKGLKYHQLCEVQVVPVKQYLQRGRPTAESPVVVQYQLEVKIKRDDAVIAREQHRAGKFILATNVLDETRYSNDELLTEYKAQQAAERGFRFLRDPLFFTSSVFLKTPSRIMALAMVMALCLLVYTLGQRLLRQNLKAQGEKIRHQLGKKTATPTLRWVFQLFQAVHLLVLDGKLYLSNLTQERKHILSLLSPSCRKYYLLI